MSVSDPLLKNLKSEIFNLKADFRLPRMGGITLFWLPEIYPFGYSSGRTHICFV